MSIKINSRTKCIVQLATRPELRMALRDARMRAADT
jgi:hypothetical protein